MSSSSTNAISINSILHHDIFIIIFSFVNILDIKTLMITIPQVCQLWRELYSEVLNVNSILKRLSNNKAIPIDWFNKMLNTFTHIKSVRYFTCYDNDIPNLYLFALAENCPGLTHVDLGGCQNQLDYAAVLKLADKCRGLKYVDFDACWNLMDVFVLGLADKCRKLKHVAFGECDKLTDAAVLGLSDKCSGLKYVDFNCCDKLTDASVLGLADKCSGLKYVDFYSCDQLTDAAVVGLTDKCRGL